MSARFETIRAPARSVPPGPCTSRGSPTRTRRRRGPRSSRRRTPDHCEKAGHRVEHDLFGDQNARRPNSAREHRASSEARAFGRGEPAAPRRSAPGVFGITRAIRRSEPVLRRALLVRHRRDRDDQCSVSRREQVLEQCGMLCADCQDQDVALVRDPTSTRPTDTPSRLPGLRAASTGSLR